MTEVNMKKVYKILLIILCAEILILEVLSQANITAQSWHENAIGVLICLLPIQVTFFLMSRDEDLSRRKRLIGKIGFWYFNICYLAGAIVTLAEQWI